MSEDTEPASGAPASGASPPKPTGRQLFAAIGVFLAVMGLLGTLPAWKSFTDNVVHGQLASWLLLVVGLVALFVAILLIRRLWAMLASMGQDKLWRMLAIILVSVIPLVVVSDVIFADVDIFNAGKAAGAAPPITNGHGRSGADGAASPLPTSSAPLQSVQLAVGSENIPFFRDPQVQKVFRDNGFNVQVTGFGSRQMAGIDFTKSRYDAVIPSSQITASQLENSTQPSVRPLKGQPEIALFRSPLAIATYQPIATCLNSLHIAYQESQGIWEFSILAYLAVSIRKSCDGALASTSAAGNAA
jgi:hypothetical protein